MAMKNLDKRRSSVAIDQRIEDGEDSQLAVATVFRAPWSQFEREWKTWIGQLDLAEERLSSMPTVLDGQGGEFATDPVLAARKDLRDKTRLGDLMARRNHHKAAGPGCGVLTQMKKLG